MISCGFRLRAKPPLPVAQNVHRMGHPTCISHMEWPLSLEALLGALHASEDLCLLGLYRATFSFCWVAVHLPSGKLHSLASRTSLVYHRAKIDSHGRPWNSDDLRISDHKIPAFLAQSLRLRLAMECQLFCRA